MQRLIVTVAVLATVLVFQAPSAQADSYSCAFTGAMGPITSNQGPENGIEAVIEDLAQGNQGDSFLGPTDPLTDSDSGDRSPDGTFHFDNVGQTVPSACLAVDDVGEATTDTGLYSAEIILNGFYDSRVCGSGWARSNPAYANTVDLTPLAAPGPGEDLNDGHYYFDYVAGVTRPFYISISTSGDDELPGGGDDESGQGRGVLNLIPTSGNCVTEDVSRFQASGAFTVLTN